MKYSEPIRKILIIRLHAVGDTAISIPACNFIKRNYPGYEQHFLTTAITAGLVGSFGIFSKVFDIGPGFENSETEYNGLSKKFKRLVSSVKTGLKLRKNKYDIVIDLQNNKFSRVVRKLTAAKRHSEFEKYTEKSHSERVMDTFNSAGFKNVTNDFSLDVEEQQRKICREILLNNGWDGIKKVILINPAGLYETRKWGMENYLGLSQLLINNGYTVLISGTEKIKNISAELKSQLGKDLIDIAGITTLKEIPGILSHISGAVSDDSGLFHIAWAMGIPGVLLLGATRSDWTCQPGEHTVCLNSSDLECGNCMRETCKWGDTRCLKRYKPEEVFNKLAGLMNTVN